MTVPPFRARRQDALFAQIFFQNRRGGAADVRAGTAGVIVLRARLRLRARRRLHVREQIAAEHRAERRAEAGGDLLFALVQRRLLRVGRVVGVVEEPAATSIDAESAPQISRSRPTPPPSGAATLSAVRSSKDVRSEKARIDRLGAIEPLPEIFFCAICARHGVPP